MGSKRIYITLNSSKNKDKVIFNYLSSYYSAKDAIKDILYKYAIAHQLSINGNDKVQKDSINKGCNKIQTAPLYTEKVRKDTDTNNNQKVQSGTLRKNEMNDLKKFI